MVSNAFSCVCKGEMKSSLTHRLLVLEPTRSERSAKSFQGRPKSIDSRGPPDLSRCHRLVAADDVFLAVSVNGRDVVFLATTEEPRRCNDQENV